jgi:transposase
VTISLELEAEIERKALVEKWKPGTICVQLGVHHETVERVLGQRTVEVVPRQPRSRHIDPFLPYIREQLALFPTLRASRLHQMVKERGYVGAKDAFRGLIAALRPRPAPEAFLRRRTLPGEEAQVDWAHFGHIEVGRARRTLWAFVMVLSYSRMRFVRFSLEAAMPAFLRGHLASFDFFGAVPRLILYDNLKSAVLEREGTAVRFNPVMIALAKHHHFEPRACAVRRGNEKGRVERAIRDLRENFFAARHWDGVDDLNAQARAWCLQIAQERYVPDEPSMRVHEAFAAEKPRLLPLAQAPFAAEHRVAVHIPKTPFARFERNDYSVPHTHVQRTLELLASEHRIRIVDGSTVIADHPRCYDRDRRIDIPEHLQHLQDHKRAAAHTRGFDRLFAAIPSSKPMMHRLAEQGANLGATTSRLLQLLDQVGAERMERAVSEALTLGMPTLRAVHHLLDKHLRESGQAIPVAIPISNPRFARAVVKHHALSTYDRIHQHQGDDDEES